MGACQNNNAFRTPQLLDHFVQRIRATPELDQLSRLADLSIDLRPFGKTRLPITRYPLHAFQFFNAQERIEFGQRTNSVEMIERIAKPPARFSQFGLDEFVKTT